MSPKSTCRFFPCREVPKNQSSDSSSLSADIKVSKSSGSKRLKKKGTLLGQHQSFLTEGCHTKSSEDTENLIVNEKTLRKTLSRKLKGSGDHQADF